jgi:hypothetical protein
VSGDQPNLFEAYAERTKLGHEKRNDRIQAKRRQNRRVKQAMIEQSFFAKQHAVLTAEEHEALIAGEWGFELQRLEAYLAELTLASGAGLVRFIQQATWLINGPADLRHAALRLIGAAIVRMREREGLVPFRRRAAVGAQVSLHPDPGAARWA